MAFNTQKITTTNKTLITFDVHRHDSIILTNSHATDAVTLDLYITSQLGTDITNTGVLAQEIEVASTSSVTLNVDTVAPTDDAFLNERVYDSSGNFFGIATTITDASPDTITFSGGIERQIDNNTALYTGTRYLILNNVKIPNGTSLKLTKDEFNVSSTNFSMYINTDSSSGGIDIIAR